MGMWDYIKGWCSSSYGFGCAAVNKINKAVRIDDATHKVKQCMTDEEAQSKIGQAAKEAAYHGFHEVLKTLPGGGPVSNLLKHFEQKSESESHEVRQLIKTLQTKVGKLEEEISICRKLTEEEEMKSQKAFCKCKSLSPIHPRGRL